MEKEFKLILFRVEENNEINPSSVEVHFSKIRAGSSSWSHLPDSNLWQFSLVVSSLKFGSDDPDDPVS